MLRSKRISIGRASFIENLGGRSISEYFNIPGEYDCRFVDETVQLRIKFESFPRVKLDLPVEIMMHITSFLYQLDCCILKLGFSEHYPWRPSDWTVVKTKNIPAEEIVRRVKCKYNIHWSPAIVIEKDVLYMLSELLFVFKASLTHHCIEQQDAIF